MENNQTTEWISVNDKLPKKREVVLVSNNYSKRKEERWVVAGQINDDGFWYNQFQDKYSDCSIMPTHWMPLPKPPIR